LGEMPSGTQTREGEVGVHSAGEEQMQVGRQVLQEEGQALVNRWLFDHVIIVQDEDEGGRMCLGALQFLEQGRQEREQRRGGWADCTSASAVSPRRGPYLPERRRAAISATQKRVGLLSSSSSVSQEIWTWRWCAQLASSVVLPKPAGAESSVSGVDSAPPSRE